MVKLGKDPGTVLPMSEQALENALTVDLAGNSNALNQQTGIGQDEVDYLGKGVPGYETTGVPNAEDDLELEEISMPVPRPGQST